jgi:hypothetical protein
MTGHESRLRTGRDACTRLARRAGALLFLALPAALVLSTLNSCGGGGDGGSQTGPCGTKTTTEEYVLPSGNDVLQPFDPQLVSTSVEDGRRHYRWDRSTEGICPDSHVRAEFRLRMNNPFATVAELRIVGRAYWFIFFERSKTLDLTGPDLYEGSVSDIGLKQAFGTNPGEITLQVDLSFPTQGSDAADLAAAQALVKSLALKLVYDPYGSPQ